LQHLKKSASFAAVTLAMAFRVMSTSLIPLTIIIMSFAQTAEKLKILKVAICPTSNLK
jgi:hypothetical protein